MKKTIFIPLCAALLLFSLTACSGTDNRLSVTTAKVKNSGALFVADFNGTIHAARSEAVIPSVSARVVSVNTEIGRRVKAGDILMQLDTSNAELALKQAQAGLDTADANYQKMVSAGSEQAVTQARQSLVAAQDEARDAGANYSLVKSQFDKKTMVAPAQAAYDKAKSAYDRMSFLVSNGQGTQYDLKAAQSDLSSASAQLASAEANAQNSLNSADSRLNSAQAALTTAQENYNLTMNSINPDNIAAAKASVDSAEASYQIAEKHIADSTVRSPIDGTVGAVNATVGDLASQQAPAFQIVGDSGMEVTVNVTETMVRKLTTGTKAAVTIDATGEQRGGLVAAVASMATAQNGMFLVKVNLDNSANLQDGMQASVRFTGNGGSGTVLVPAKSVQTRGGKTVVFAARGGKAVQVAVTAVETQGAYVSVKGLAAGDEVIVQGAGKAVNGADLHIVSNTNG